MRGIYTEGNAALALSTEESWSGGPRLARGGGGGDRRNFVRHDISLAVRELHPEWHLGRATSVSAGGMFCPEAAPRPVGTKLLIEIYTLANERPLLAAARVAHAGKGPTGMGIGLEFTRPQKELGEYLRRYAADKISE